MNDEGTRRNVDKDLHCLQVFKCDTRIVRTQGVGSE